MIKTPQRLIFFGTPDFAALHLKALWDAHKTMIPSIEFLVVFTQPDRPVGRNQSLNASPVKRVALASHLPLFQPLSLRHADLERQFHDWEPDLVIVVAYGLIIPRALLTVPRLGFLNVHASLLPRHRGASPIQAALLAGDQETGVTLMQMDEHVDTGPIYTQSVISIAPGETAASLHDRLAQCGAKALCEALPAILEDQLRSKPQHGDASTCPKIQKDFGKLHWSESASVNDRKIRALNPWPGTFTTWTAKKKDDKNSCRDSRAS